MKQLIFDYIRIIASKQPEINQEFKNKILLQSSDFIDGERMNIIQDFKELKNKKEEAWRGGRGERRGIEVYLNRGKGQWWIRCICKRTEIARII